MNINLKQSRAWRLGIWFANRLEPCTGDLSWEEKRIRIKRPAQPFSEKGIYGAVFADPTYPYALIRAHMKPVHVDRDEDRINEIIFEFYHRKK